MSLREDQLFPPSIVESLRNLRLLALDVDGVLTDGRLRYGPEGESVKVFHSKDGLGIKLLQDEGVEVAVISARKAPALERRLADLSVDHAYLGRGDKQRALGELLVSTGVDARRVAFMGDDVLDLPALRRVGVAIAPGDAHALVRSELSAGGWITRANGGHGAVREVCDGILAARGCLESVVEAHIQKRNRAGRHQ